jgi:hypothetical protein
MNVVIKARIRMWFRDNRFRRKCMRTKANYLGIGTNKLTNLLLLSMNPASGRLILKLGSAQPT